MRNKLTEKQITLLIDIIRQSELFIVKVDNCKEYYKMTQSQARKTSIAIIDKLVLQREKIKAGDSISPSGPPIKTTKP